MKRLIAAGVLAAAFLIGGCGSGGRGTIGAPDLTVLNGNPGGSTPPEQPTSSTALFQPAAGVLPYPTDLYFAGSTDGTLNIQPANALMPNQAAVNALDGFSTNAVIREFASRTRFRVTPDANPEADAVLRGTILK